eukprot:TRINITY_DN9606_c0_g1_i1.p1 TRINITY_DN9606_c0_g1~~TRINITY_DN9606_c0_g1_i1.p1  ORF type:complete len:385 (+),score=116.52 TRINITY_DN9606_c0_g1_i1:74-1228(+)
MAENPEIIVNEESNSSVSVSEILDDEIALQEEAENQLSNHNWGDEDSCTYNDGYKKQAIFSCETCYDTTKDPEAKKFGFCYGCSMNCHVDHRVIELFEKRDFRCDCGTPKTKCKCLLSEGQPRTEDNDKNHYNHNFDGLYCWCDGPYSSSDMVMHQCVFCQDWFHIECIAEKEKRQFSAEEEEFDFVCCDCVPKYPFLKSYTSLLVDATDAATSQDVPDSGNGKEEGTSLKRKREEEDENKNPVECPVKSGALVDSKTVDKIVNMRLDKYWMTSLCECDDCRKNYENLGVSFLLEEKHFLESDEPAEDASAKPKKPVSFDIDSNPALKALPHEAKVNVMLGFNSMMSNMKDYFKSFAESGQEVTAADVNTFFEGLNKKRRKINE